MLINSKLRNQVTFHKNSNFFMILLYGDFIGMKYI